jgi:hypothetical protein
MVSQDQPSTSASSYVLWCQGNTKEVFITTRTKDYYSPDGSVVDHPSTTTYTSTSTPPTTSPLHIEKASSDTIIQPPPKGDVHRSVITL